MIRDKRVDVEAKQARGATTSLIDDGGEAYAKVAKEVDQVKMMILDMRAGQAGGVEYNRPSVEGAAAASGFHRRARKQVPGAVP